MTPLQAKSAMNLGEESLFENAKLSKLCLPPVSNKNISQEIY